MAKSYRHNANFVCLFVYDRVSPCSSNWPGTDYVAQASLELTEVQLPLPFKRQN